MTTWEKIKHHYYKEGSAIHQIVIISLAAFIFSTLLILAGKLGSFNEFALLKYFYLPSDFGTILIRPWSLITNIFFHSGVRHAIGNIFTLYFIGRILEDFIGNNKVWILFLVGGLSGGLLFVLGFNLFPVFSEYRKVAILLGASGGLAAIITATGFFLPNFEVRPFGLFNIKMKNVASLIMFVMLTYPIIDNNFGGFFAHLGGAIFGMLYILHLQGKIELPTFSFNKVVPSKMKKVVVDEEKIAKDRAHKKHQPNQEEIDAILDKISQSGYDSLSKSEKEILFKASE